MTTLSIHAIISTQLLLLFHNSSAISSFTTVINIHTFRYNQIFFFEPSFGFKSRLGFLGSGSGLCFRACTCRPVYSSGMARSCLCFAEANDICSFATPGKVLDSFFLCYPGKFLNFAYSPSGRFSRASLELNGL